MSYILVEGRKVNVPKGSKGCIVDDPSVAPTGEKLGRVEYDPAMFKDPAEMDGEEFERWLDRASPDTLEAFCSLGRGRYLGGLTSAPPHAKILMSF